MKPRRCPQLLTAPTGPRTGSPRHRLAGATSAGPSSRVGAAGLCGLILALTCCKPPVPDARTAHPQVQHDPEEHTGFHPIEPMDAALYWNGDPIVHYDDLDGDGHPGNTNIERLSAFPVEAAHVQIVQLSSEGSIHSPILATQAAGTRYVVTLDYVKYRTDETTEGCLVQTGVGIRMRARVETLEAGVRVSTPFALGAAATAGRIRGDLSFQTIGVHGKVISPLVPLPSKLSEEAIQAGLIAAGAIKASLYADKDVLIRPQVFGHTPEDKCRTPGTAGSAFVRPQESSGRVDSALPTAPP